MDQLRHICQNCLSKFRIHVKKWSPAFQFSRIYQKFPDLLAKKRAAPRPLAPFAVAGAAW
ncbi:MAG: hypothetical protein DME42_07695 [Verrucomicrobia bacterium]|nr:MAG: hypothetical protein DME42_07695 [Verrucomicrobiota bacterium]